MKNIATFASAFALASAAMAMGIDRAGEAALSAGGPHLNGLSMAMLIFGVVVYFLPTFLAMARRKVLDFPMIFLVNFLLGWTVIGWILPLFWSIGERITVKEGRVHGHAVAR